MIGEMILNLTLTQHSLGIYIWLFEGTCRRKTHSILYSIKEKNNQEVHCSRIFLGNCSIRGPDGGLDIDITRKMPYWDNHHWVCFDCVVGLSNALH